MSCYIFYRDSVNYSIWQYVMIADKINEFEFLNNNFIKARESLH